MTESDMKMKEKLIRTLQKLYEKASNAAHAQDFTVVSLHTTFGVSLDSFSHQSPCNTLELIMNYAFEDVTDSVNFRGKSITDLRFGDNNYGLVGCKDELTKFISHLDMPSWALDNSNISSTVTSVMILS